MLWSEDQALTLAGGTGTAGEPLAEQELFLWGRTCLWLRARASGDQEPSRSAQPRTAQHTGNRVAAGEDQQDHRPQGRWTVAGSGGLDPTATDVLSCPAKTSRIQSRQTATRPSKSADRSPVCTCAVTSRSPLMRCEIKG